MSFFVAVCAANPEIRPFVFPAVSASFLCDTCAVDGFGLASQLCTQGSLGFAYALAHGLLCYYTRSVVLSIVIIMVIIILRMYVCVIQTGNRHCH